MADEPNTLLLVLKRLAAVERRLDRLELAHEKPGVAPAPAMPPPLPEQAAPAPPPVAISEEFVAEQPRIAEPADVAPVPPSTPPGPIPSLTRPASVPNRDRPRRQPARPAWTDWKLEQTIGLKWAGWVGAVVLAVGAGLGIKFAYDQGWFGHLPPWFQLTMYSLGGFALLAAGEVVYRRVNVVSAAGLFGAGVAVLFLVSYAGNLYYAVYSYRTAFAFAVLTSLVGSGVAMRGGLVSIAVLSQIGGLLGPLVLSSGQPPGLALLGYVLMLEFIALVLALWGRHPKWWVLRGVSLAGTAFWTAVALAEGHWGRGLSNEVWWFALLAAAGYQGELLRSALWVGETDERLTGKLPRGWGAGYSVLVTAWLTGVLLVVFYGYDSPSLRGSMVLVLAAVVTLAGLSVPGVNPLVRNLNFGYLLQGMALVILFVPVTLTDLWIGPAWAVLALTFGVLGARYARDLARGGSLATWVLAVARLLLDIADHAGPVWLDVTGHPIHAVTVIAWVVAVAALAGAWLIHVDWKERELVLPRWQGPAIAVAILASVLWVVASASGLPNLGVTLALLTWAWVLVGADYCSRRLHYAAHTTVILVLAAFKWLIRDNLAERLDSKWNALDYVPLLNPQTGLGVLIALSVGGFVWLRRESLERELKPREGKPSSSVWEFATVAIMLAVVTAAFSFQVDLWVRRAVQLNLELAWPADQVMLFGLTLLWLVAVLVLGAEARRLKYRTPLPWVLLLLVVGKFLVADMLVPRLAGSPNPAPAVVLNLQVLTAAVVLMAVWTMSRLLPAENLGVEGGKSFGVVGNLLALVILLAAGTLEIDRAFSSRFLSGLYDPHLAKHMAVSLFWSLFAVTAVAVGFLRRNAGLRYFGLALFGLTLLKVGAVDLQQVRYGYRVLSLLGLGLVLLATSVLYGRLSSKLLGNAPDERKTTPVGAEE